VLGMFQQAKLINWVSRLTRGDGNSPKHSLECSGKPLSHRRS
jgi:hypothetical protein